MADYIFAPGAPAAIGPYCHCVKAGGLVFASGQLGVDAETGVMPEGAAAQAELGLKNLATVLAAAGTDLSRVVKTTVFLADMADFAAVNEVYARAFGDTKPARSCVAVAGLPKGAAFEIEAIAEV